MSKSETNGSQGEVERLLAGAAKTVKESSYCWLMTAAAGAGANARPMGLVARALNAESWTVSFLTDGRSHKVEDIRRVNAISLLFQVEPQDAFVKLDGKAVLQEDRNEVLQRWKRAYEPYFPTEVDRLHAIFVDVLITKLDLWIRGVTPEPFGLQTTTLEREVQGPWRLV